jgi:hypothetical protein
MPHGSPKGRFSLMLQRLSLGKAWSPSPLRNRHGIIKLQAQPRPERVERRATRTDAVVRQAHHWAAQAVWRGN